MADPFGTAVGLGDVVLLGGDVFDANAADAGVRVGKQGHLVTHAELVHLDSLHLVGYHRGALLGVSNVANPLTTVEFYIDDFAVGAGSLASSTYRIPIERDCTAAVVAVRARTFTVSPPSWTLELYKQATKVGTFAFSFATFASFAVSVGSWAVVDGENLDFSVSAGDTWHLKATGTDVNAAEIVVQCGWITR